MHEQCVLSARHREENAMPFTVVFLNRNDKVDTRECETETEAVAYAKARQSFQFEATSVIVIDGDTQEIVFTGQATESKCPGAPKASADPPT
jgi:hypothetical protein